MVLWVRHFLEMQGYTVKDNIVYQDNLSAIKLEKNGKDQAQRTLVTWRLDISLLLIMINFLFGNILVL